MTQVNAMPSADQRRVNRELTHTSQRRVVALFATVAAATALAGCGGGGTDAGSPPPPAPTTSQSFAQQCTPTNPYRADASTATTTGSLTTEKQWVRAYIDENYLWYSQVPTLDAAAARYSNGADVYASLDNYFNDLTTIPSDRFSFTYPTKQWNALSQSGVSLGYGMEFVRGSATPPRNYRIAYVEAGTQAANVGLRRGDTIVSVDGVSIDDSTSAGVATLNAALNPSAAGNHSFVVSRGGVTQPAVTLAAGDIATTPVPVVRVHTVGTQRVGYMLFNDHVLPAESQLINAINTFRTQGISDLVVDLRYNGGGYLYLASQLAYMVAGINRTSGKNFETSQYNNKRTAETNNSATPFFSTSCLPNASFQCTNTGALPALNLARVWVLTKGGTCSASEAFINGLRGIDVEVRLVGSTTCGKPYGFTAKDNCGISYFPIEFKGVNAKGFGDYDAGFSAQCSAADDLSRDLGDVNEGMLAAALFNRNNNSCSTAFGLGKPGEVELQSVRGPERSNRIVVPLK